MLAYAKQQINIAMLKKLCKQLKCFLTYQLVILTLSQIGNLTKNGDIAGASNRFTGIQAGISIPLFYGSYKASIKSAKLKEQWLKPMPTTTNVSSRTV